jgi:transaldolase
METLSMTRIFADGANLQQISALNQNSKISGFTTNPTLMKKAGLQDYERFAKDVLSIIGEKSLSLEVFSDDLTEMKRQAVRISSWGKNVFVKIPVTNTNRISTSELVKELNKDGIKVNVTAIMSPLQIVRFFESYTPELENYFSVFAGRIADTGRDPLPLMIEALEIASANEFTKLIWASPREVFNYYQAQSIGCHIITMAEDLIAKLELGGLDLADYSLETVKMFRNDAISAGFEL